VKRRRKGRFFDADDGGCDVDAWWCGWALATLLLMLLQERLTSLSSPAAAVLLVDDMTMIGAAEAGPSFIHQRRTAPIEFLELQ
jgi:hypothetical protein